MKLRSITYVMSVTVNDDKAAHKYNVHTFPSLAYFRKQSPIFYDGDLLDEEKVLKWLTSNDVFELKDEIEEVNRKMLDKLLNDNDFVAVFFCECLCFAQHSALTDITRSLVSNIITTYPAHE